MVGADIQVAEFVRSLSDIERRKLPSVTVRALNVSAFEVRDEWAREIPQVFDDPTSITLRSPLYRKATPQRMHAEVFIRDEVLSGTPPSEYLKPQAFGGPRQQKRSEAALSRYTGFPPYFVPARGAPLDAYGNLRRGLIQRILSQLQATHDPAQRETEAKRGRRLRRQQRRGGGGHYFTVPVARGALKRGVVYERIVSGFGSAVRPILIGVESPPQYRVRFDAFALAQRIFVQRFRVNFTAMLTTAIGRGPGQ